jgi:hypothetical protein
MLNISENERIAELEAIRRNPMIPSVDFHIQFDSQSLTMSALMAHLAKKTRLGQRVAVLASGPNTAGAIWERVRGGFERVYTLTR